MKDKFTREMVIATMFARYIASEAYTEVKEALEAVGNLKADQILKQVWDDDIESIIQNQEVGVLLSSFDSLIIKHREFMFHRNEKLANKYRVMDSNLWEAMYKVARDAYGCWADYQMLLDYLSTCDSHIEKGGSETELQQWKKVKRLVEEFLDTTEEISPRSLYKLNSDINLVWNPTKK